MPSINSLSEDFKKEIAIWGGGSRQRSGDAAGGDQGHDLPDSRGGEAILIAKTQSRLIRCKITIR
jgi:hypothetical protein